MESDADGDYFMKFPARYGDEKIWFSDFKYGIVFKIYSNPAFIDSFELVNLINRKSNISKLIVNEDISAAVFCLHIPYLTKVDAWLQECLNNFILEINLIHKSFE